MDEIQVKCDDEGVLVECEGEVDLTICPYEFEINERSIPVWLCRAHYFERCQDI